MVKGRVPNRVWLRETTPPLPVPSQALPQGGNDVMQRLRSAKIDLVDDQRYVHVSRSGWVLFWLR